MWPLPQKHGYRPKPEFYRWGFVKFDCFVLAPNLLVSSENWLVCISYDQESIPNMVYFFGIFLYSNMKEMRCLMVAQLYVWMLSQKQGYRPKTNLFNNFIWTLFDLFYNGYSHISFWNTVEKCKMHLRS